MDPLMNSNLRCLKELWRIPKCSSAANLEIIWSSKLSFDLKSKKSDNWESTSPKICGGCLSQDTLRLLLPKASQLTGKTTRFSTQLQPGSWATRKSSCCRPTKKGRKSSNRYCRALEGRLRSCVERSKKSGERTSQEAMGALIKVDTPPKKAKSIP